MTSGGYAAPRSLDEAVSLLAKNPDARVLAGGHGLLVEPSRSRIAGSLLVDLRNIPGLAGIDREPSGGVKIGAMVTLSAIATNELVGKTYPMLAEAALLTGDPQMRNRVTIGGSIASTDPEAELRHSPWHSMPRFISWGRRVRALCARDEFFAGTALPLRADDVITALTIPAPAARSGMAYVAQRNPATLSPICGVAVSVALGADGAVAASRVALAGAAARPMRLASAEKALANKRAADAAAAATAAAGGRDHAYADLFASADYRTHLTRVLTERAIKQAFARAGA